MQVALVKVTLLVSTLTIEGIVRSYSNLSSSIKSLLSFQSLGLPKKGQIIIWMWVEELMFLERHSFEGWRR